MGNQRGVVLVMGLLLLLALTVIAMGSMSTMVTDVKISGNYDAAQQVFFVAEAGLEDARSRLNPNLSNYPITDDETDNPYWVVIIGTQERADETGLDYTYRVDPLEPNLDYTVVISHKVNDSNQVLKFGDTDEDGVPEVNTTYGGSIYEITSTGRAKNNAQKSLSMVIAKYPPVRPVAALYTKGNTRISGSSTKIIGSNACGTTGQPGIIATGDIETTGDPEIVGEPIDQVEYSDRDVDINYLVSSLKDYATHAYSIASDTTMTGMNWGTPCIPATDEPSSCSIHNVVYFNAPGSTIKLTGASGCGILAVNGNLEANGGFSWHGLIVVTGSIKFSGGGEKNITGGVIAGTEVSDNTISGNMVIIYCSTAIRMQTSNLPPIVLSWAEVF